MPTHEEAINEAPELFNRNGIYYLLFSHGWFNSQYAMSYIMADSLPQPTATNGQDMHVPLLIP